MRDLALHPFVIQSAFVATIHTDSLAFDSIRNGALQLLAWTAGIEASS
jgi:hypothetical protein